jgi:hypothetical protein
MCVFASMLLVQAFDRRVAARYGMPTSAMRALKPCQLRDPILFDQWAADRSPLAPAP